MSNDKKGLVDCHVRLTHAERRKALRAGSITDGIRQALNTARIVDKVVAVNILLELIMTRQRMEIISEAVKLNPELLNREILNVELDGIMGIRKRIEDLLR